MSSRRSQLKQESFIDDNGGGYHRIAESENRSDEEGSAVDGMEKDREEENDDDDEMSRGETEFTFSQQVPEASQSIYDVRPSEKQKLDRMDHISRDKAVTTLSRLVLFKALAREPIDRLKIIKEAGISNERISTAALEEVANRLHNVFGFELSRIPKYMEDMKSTPKRFKDRYYVTDGLADHDGTHSKAIHSVHESSAIERGLLMLVLALTYCKGKSRSDGSRWIHDRDLYRLLHDVDEGIPQEPPVGGTARAKAGSQSSLKNRTRFRQNASLTPKVDALLDLFCNQDYLIREKATEDTCEGQFEDGDQLYAMGPRAAMEIGIKQIIYFCAEILDEVPDPTMLKEVEDKVEEEGEGDDDMVDGAEVGDAVGYDDT